MFGIDATEFVIILVLAVVMFGPEKLPEYSRKAARIFVYLRDIANSAKGTLRAELGPGYSDLELRDLHPKAFIAKHLREEVALIDEAKREIQGASASLRQSTREVKQQAREAVDAADGSVALPAPIENSPFDAEST